MRRFLERLDDALEGVATFIYGPLPKGESRPSLWTKLGVFAMLALLIALGIAASRW